LNTLIKLGKEYKLWSSSLCSSLQPPAISSPFGRNILLSTPFSNHLRLCSALNVIYWVSHSYITTGKIIVLYILICMLLDSRREDERFWTKWYQSLLQFILFLITSWIKFWFYCHS
jgi:hypothetical protein